MNADKVWEGGACKSRICGDNDGSAEFCKHSDWEDTHKDAGNTCLEQATNPDDKSQQICVKY